METPRSPAAAADWLRLWRLVQQSSHSMASLLAAFADPAGALSASPSQWRALGVAPVRAQRLHAWQHRRDADLCREMDEGVAADLAWCETPGQALLFAGDSDYPPLLREIADAPPLLFLKGDADALALPQVAIVGTRQPSLTGREDAHAFAAGLAAAGLAITSGMARGIDACAHAGALAAGGRTVAVLGTGPDLRYPRGNSRLYDAVLAGGGLIVSEFLPGTPPLPAHFPRRNRVISGLALGVLVVEAAPESGSLITARLAAEQGRPVWALAGSRHNPLARGCLHLIREGASAVSDAGHILTDLPPLLGFLREQVAPPPAAPSPAPDDEARRVLEALGCERRHPDWLVAATGLAPATVLKALTRLELAGRVAAVPGGYERRG
jgi:DNA processing protein